MVIETSESVTSPENPGGQTSGSRLAKAIPSISMGSTELQHTLFELFPLMKIIGRLIQSSSCDVVIRIIPQEAFEVGLWFHFNVNDQVSSWSTNSSVSFL